MNFANIKNKPLYLILGSLILLIILSLLAIIIWYMINISPISENNEMIKVEIPIGSTIEDTANILEENKLIRNSLAFRIYIKLNKIDTSSMQAGIYTISPTYTINEMIQLLKTGIIMDDKTFNVTFIEGRSITKIVSLITNVTNTSEEEIYNLLKDQEYLDELIEKYWFLTDEIKNENIYYPLEGYLFPDTYEFELQDLTAKKIFEKMLNQMDSVLSMYKDDIEKSGYTVHQLLTMASLCELEAVIPEDRSEVAGVFYNRLSCNSSLGSDVTTYYAIGVELGVRDLYQSELDTYNPYNTRGPNMEGKLPIGPITCVSKASIEAAIYPKQTDNLFFVADKYGKLYFTKTLGEHSAIITKLQNEGLWIEF